MKVNNKDNHKVRGECLLSTFKKLFIIMILIQVPIALLIDFGLMNMWGLSLEMLVLAWVAVVGLNALAYWIAVATLLLIANWRGKRTDGRGI